MVFTNILKAAAVVCLLLLIAGVFCGAAAATERDGAYTGSDAGVSGGKLMENPSSQITQALQNRVAGVDMQQTNTQPGAEMKIRIRGERSLSASNDPLIVLDGIPFQGNLSDISPSDIKSLDILKDASATAIYGSRGANGVITVPTATATASGFRNSIENLTSRVTNLFTNISTYRIAKSNGTTIQVKGDDIAKLNTTNALEAMQSSTPGVQITQKSAQPGKGFKVNIRGIGTIGNTSPLYVIDGVTSSTSVGLNPNNIESIDVLKDGASAAIYGARAANSTEPVKYYSDISLFDGVQKTISKFLTDLFSTFLSF